METRELSLEQREERKNEILESKALYPISKKIFMSL
jgi:hypothetical protein